MSNKDKNCDFRIPYLIDSAADLRTLGKKRSDVILYKLGSRYYPAVMIENSDPEIYHGMMQLLWAEKKRESRESRCLLSSGTGGFIRCMRNCSDCPKYRSGKTQSLDFKKVAGRYEPSDPIDVLGMAIDILTLEQLIKRVSGIDPEVASLLKVMRKLTTERELAEYLGVSRSTAHCRLVAAVNLARKIFDGEF